MSQSGAGTVASSGLQSALSSLNPGTLSAIQGAVGTVNNLQPAVSVAQTLESGGTVTPQQVTSVLALTATMTMGPVAGAAVAVAGEAVSAIFDALQGPPPPPPPAWNYNGFLRLGQIQGNSAGAFDPVPYGPKDPTWLSFTNSSDVITAVQKGVPTLNRPPVSGNFSYSTAQVLAVCMELLEMWPIVNQSVSSQNWSQLDISAMNVSSDALNFYQHLSWYGGVEVIGTSGHTNQLDAAHFNIWKGLTQQGGTQVSADSISSSPSFWQSYALQQIQIASQHVTAATFPLFFAATLATNIMQWVNGHSFIPAYQLLVACAAAWNASYSNSTMATYDPDDYYANTDQLYMPYVPEYGDGSTDHNTILQKLRAGPPVNDWELVPLAGWVNPIYTVLSGWDIGEVDPAALQANRHPPLVINTGPLGGSSAAGVGASGGVAGWLSGLSTGEKIALGVAAVPVAATLGGVGYALATKQSTGRVLKGMWNVATSPLGSIGKGAKRLVGAR
jgi:hypothetical protein